MSNILILFLIILLISLVFASDTTDGTQDIQMIVSFNPISVDDTFVVFKAETPESFAVSESDSYSFTFTGASFEVIDATETVIYTTWNDIYNQQTSTPYIDKPLINNGVIALHPFFIQPFPLLGYRKVTIELKLRVKNIDATKLSDFSFHYINYIDQAITGGGSISTIYPSIAERIDLKLTYSKRKRRALHLPFILTITNPRQALPKGITIKVPDILEFYGPTYNCVTNQDDMRVNMTFDSRWKEMTINNPLPKGPFEYIINCNNVMLQVRKPAEFDYSHVFTVVAERETDIAVYSGVILSHKEVKEQDGIKWGAIIAVILAILVLFIVFVVICYCDGYTRRRRHRLFGSTGSPAPEDIGSNGLSMGMMYENSIQYRQL